MSAAIQNEMERVRAERDALQQQLNAALEREVAMADRCPEGWQCVPKSVTPAMADAYASDAYDTAQQCHDAVLGVAPHPGDADEAINSNPAASIARRDYEVMNKIRESMEQERDALAAHVERLRNACQMAFQTPLDEHYSKGVNVALHHAIESTGENNLARRDLIKQAEALKAESENQEYSHWARSRLADSAAQYMQRAQELTE